YVGQDNRTVAMPHQGSGQTLQFAARQQHVLAAERADNALADTAALALTLDEVEIGVASGCLLADVHPMCCPRVRPKIKHIPAIPLQMFHYTIGRDPKIDPPCHGKSIIYRPKMRPKFSEQWARRSED